VLGTDWYRTVAGPRADVALVGATTGRRYWSLTLDSPQQAADYANDLRQRLAQLGHEGLLAEHGAAGEDRACELDREYSPAVRRELRAVMRVLLRRYGPPDSVYVQYADPCLV
jgi:hypothetical protein